MAEPPTRPLVKYCLASNAEWQGPARLITWGRGYAAVELPRLANLCGSLLGTFDPIMAWHQGLHNPIPNFNLNLKTEVHLPKHQRPLPITWRQVKATTYQAQQQLAQANLPQTPENLVAAVFAIITANFVTILFCILLSSLGSVTALNDTQPIQLNPNLWVRHAQYMFLVHGTNVTLYYEPPMAFGQVVFIPDLISSSSFIVSQLQNIHHSWLFSKPPAQLNSVHWRYLHTNQFTKGLCFCCYAHHTWLNNWNDYAKARRILSKVGNYSYCTGYYWLWGTFNSLLYGPNLVPEMYPDNFHIFNASDMTDTESICASWQLKDPNMWFFFDKYATKVHPQNYQCAAIGYFSLPVQIGALFFFLTTTPCSIRSYM
ncbi:uncharacterized protein LOC117674936 isoform X2 [Pantherophis guttatus]|uniref:Uncharacterized protein LOC117674936 isoform X2 n=1 Tax=Pantherophis guttatus TaxID=94885 RepID=A0ABM3ZNT3_PANGU|nr:uncharacterized protein LOC117674936 isoform X2 [Pantherophis guttatus]